MISHRLARVGSAVLVFALLASGCAPTTTRPEPDRAAVLKEQEIQRQMAVKQAHRYQRRLDTVSYPILRSGIELCGKDVQPRLGMFFNNVYSYDASYQSAARTALGLGERMSIVYVTPGSPAEQAGLSNNDVLLDINGVAAPAGKSGVKKTTRLLANALDSGRPIRITVERAGRAYPTTVTPEVVCAYPVILDQSDALNAFADGENIYITKGMLRFVESDNELALVIAHELAHNAMSHIGKKTGNYALGSVLDIAAAVYGIDTQNAFGKMASNAHSQAFESEADYVGLYLMAMADLPIGEANEFWRRMAVEYPGSIEGSYTATHPSTSERFVAIDETVGEIMAKLDAGEPLVPERK